MSLAAPPVASPTESVPTRRRRFGGPVVLAAAAAGVVVGSGLDRSPADLTKPLEVRGEIAEPAPQDGRRFRVGTFNIHGGRGPAGPIDLEATAAVLRESRVDVVALNEVHASFTDDQAADLGGRLGMASVFLGTERRWWHDHFGNGVLARRPLRGTLPIPLPGTQGKRFRNAILTSFDAGGVTVRFLATHIDTETDRDRQVAAIFDLFLALEPPVILAGDFNSRLDHPAIRTLAAEPGVIDVVSQAAGQRTAAGQIDHLFVRGLDVIDGGVVTTKVSDHPHVWAELAVPSRDDE